MSRRRGMLLAFAIVAGSVAVATVMVRLRPEPARRPVPSRTPIAVTAPAVAGDGALAVRGAGTVRPRSEIEVAAEVTGRIVSVHPAFESGGRVRAGQELFRIDDTDYRHAVERAHADVAVQRTELTRVREEAEIARAEYERFATRQAEGAQAAEAGPLARWEPQVEAAEAAVARAAVALAEAETRLSRTGVTAPFDGVVRSERVEVGQVVTAGVGVGRLYPADAVEVVVPLVDDDAALIPDLWKLEAGRNDRSVPVRVLARYGDAGFVWEGYVDRVEAWLDEGTRTIEVVVRVPDPFTGGVPATPADGDQSAPIGESRSAPLLPGTFVEVSIEGVAPERYFRIPRSALRPGNEVWAVRAGARLTIVPVRTLQVLDDEVFVAGALEPGEPVVTGGIQVATEGMEVRTGTGAER